MCCWDWEEPEIRNMYWRRARKQHECYACHETIRTGDLYHIDSQRLDGEFYRFKHCARCWRMIEFLWSYTCDAVAYDLDCGAEPFDEDDPDAPHEIAFWTPDDAQEWARRAAEPDPASIA